MPATQSIWDRRDEFHLGLVAILLFCSITWITTMSASSSYESIVRDGEKAHAERIRRLFNELNHPAFRGQSTSHPIRPIIKSYGSLLPDAWYVPTQDWLWLVPIILVLASLVGAVRAWFDQDAEGRWFAAKVERALQHAIAAPIHIVCWTIYFVCVVIGFFLRLIYKLVIYLIAIALIPFWIAYDFLVQPSIDHISIARVRVIGPDETIEEEEDESESAKIFRGFCWLVIVAITVWSVSHIFSNKEVGPTINDKPVGIKTFYDSLQWSQACENGEAYGCWEGVKLHKYNMNNPNVGRVWPSQRRLPVMGKPLPTVTEIRKVTDTEFVTTTDTTTSTEQHTLTETEHVAITHTLTSTEKETAVETEYFTQTVTSTETELATEIVTSTMHHTVTETITKDNFETLWEQAVPVTITETVHITLEPADLGPTFTTITVTETEEVVHKEIEQITFTSTDTVTDTVSEPPQTVTSTETQMIVTTTTETPQAQDFEDDSWAVRVNQPYWCQQKVDRSTYCPQCGQSHGVAIGVPCST